jgi:hypothetical protein
VTGVTGPSTSGAVQEVRFAITTGATQNSATTLPNNAIVIACELDITTPYSGGATIKVGNSTTTDLLMGTAQNDPQLAALYSLSQDTTFTPSATILVTVAGAPGAGAGFCIVRYVATPQA